jgi:hypothetical protein
VIGPMPRRGIHTETQEHAHPSHRLEREIFLICRVHDGATSRGGQHTKALCGEPRGPMNRQETKLGSTNKTGGFLSFLQVKIFL